MDLQVLHVFLMKTRPLLYHLLNDKRGLDLSHFLQV